MNYDGQMISQNQALGYEIRSSWWTPLVSNERLQELAGRYFAWKLRRKYNRYTLSYTQSKIRNAQ